MSLPPTPAMTPRLTDTPTAVLPDLAQVRAFVAVPADFLPDDDLTRMLDAAIAIIVKTCRTPGYTPGATWPAPLVEAVLRRVQRSIATKNLPLGFIDSASEYGPARIPNYDVQIEELEGRYRRVVFG